MSEETKQLEIYNELKSFIENCSNVETLRNMLIETIDNNATVNIEDLHRNYIFVKENINKWIQFDWNTYINNKNKYELMLKSTQKIIDIKKVDSLFGQDIRVKNEHGTISYHNEDGSYYVDKKESSLDILMREKI